MRPSPTVALAVVLISAAGGATARPFAPGRCSTVDDGVDETARSVQMRDAGLTPLSMELPRQAPERRGLAGAFVADVALTVDAAGAVSRPAVLCTSPSDADYSKALLELMPRWSFRAPAGASRPIRVAYRIVLAQDAVHYEAIPLGLVREG